MNWKERLKSPVVWASFLAQLVVIGGAFGLWDLIGITAESLQIAISSVLECLTIFGILNNPTDRDGF